MMYVICRKLSEIKYDIPEGAKIIVNDCAENFYGEIAAWFKIYKDAKANGYDRIGIYQARRAFHVNGKILSDADYDLDKADCYVTKYNLNNFTLYSQFKESHRDYMQIIDEVLPEDLKKLSKEIHYIFPHSMFYTSFTNFEKLMNFIMQFAAPVKKFKFNNFKIFSIFVERLVTLFFLNEKLKIAEVDCFRFNKLTGKVDATIAGLDKWHKGFTYVIVHFNTPKLTSCLIRNLRKFDEQCKIVVFDNSTKDPLPSVTCDVYYDNTAGQIIDFNKELEKYPNKVESSRIINNFGSAKHSMTIEWLIQNINEGFVLLDSDVLLTRPLNFLSDEYLCISDLQQFRYPNKPYCDGPLKTRVLPFVIYLNAPMIKKFNLSFFDPSRMDGLSFEGHENDTGTSFYEDLIKFNPQAFKRINHHDYIIHYGQGSYKRNNDAADWCMKHIQLWK